MTPPPTLDALPDEAGARPSEARVTDAPLLSAVCGAVYDRRSSGRPPADPRLSLERLRAAQVLRDIDVHAARTIARLASDDDPLVALGAGVASLAPGVGHVCAELDAPERLLRTEHDVDVPWPRADAWREALAASAAVALARDCAPDAVARPLVLDGDRLYLARYWRYERRLADALGRRAVGVRGIEPALAGRLQALFPDDAEHGGLPLQRIAAATAVLRDFAVVTGGPGTGKTTTVLGLLAVLIEQAIAAGSPLPRIALAAPTGKAAARLGESVRAGIERLRLRPEVAQHIPRGATTLHRLLGWQPRTPTRFRHCAADPIAADVVVVDESSMAGLPLMAKLVDAVRPDARLVLLGDRDQLASVEAGAILADLCGDGPAPRSHVFAARLGALCGTPDLAAEAATEAPPIADCVVRLAGSRRFRPDAGIGALARAINAGDADAALAVLGADGGSGDPTGEVAFVALDPARTGHAGEPTSWLREFVAKQYRSVVRADGPAVALALLDRFRLLAAHREGPLGVAGLGAAIRRALRDDGTLDASEQGTGDGWYHGQPILVTANAPALDLYNGDVGVVLRDGAGGLRAWFRTADGGPRGVTPARLPAHEPAFAMTVHKAQGSEFDEVVLVLPAAPSPVLTRELLYTAVTRARTRVTIVGTPDIMRAAIAEQVQRASGLRDVLWRMT